MNTRLLLLPAAGASLLALAACQAPPARATLDCPTKVGGLTRTAAAADGKSCDYLGKRGTVLHLAMLPLAGTVEQTLAPIGEKLRAESAVVTPADAPIDKDGADKDGADTDEAHVDLPGLHVDAKGGDAQVTLGEMHVDASDGEAVVQVQHDVRLHGQPFALKREGFKASLVIAGDHLPTGVKSIGYDAAGRKTGPVVVGVFRSPDDDRGDIKDDILRLVHRNGGV